ncbi:MAG: hypothetical protein RIM84_13310 [Alphaproteobacteria bacterium]
MGLYFAGALVAICWLFYWIVKCETKPGQHEDKGPFALRDGKEIAEKYGKRMPF